MPLSKSDMTLTMRDLGRVPTPAALDGLALDADIAGPQIAPRPPPRTFADCVASLGMDASTALVWQRYLGEVAAQMPDEVGFRSSLVGKMREDGLPASMRKALLGRSLSVYRAQVRRPTGGMGVYPGLRKSAAGRYQACRSAVRKAADVDGGVAMGDLGSLVETFGAPLLSEVLYDEIDGGGLSFDGARFVNMDGCDVASSLNDYATPTAAITPTMIARI